MPYDERRYFNTGIQKFYKAGILQSKEKELETPKEKMDKILEQALLKKKKKIIKWLKGKKNSSHWESAN